MNKEIEVDVEVEYFIKVGNMFVESIIDRRGIKLTLSSREIKLYKCDILDEQDIKKSVIDIAKNVKLFDVGEVNIIRREISTKQKDTNVEITL